jgi:zinc transporter 9
VSDAQKETEGHHDHSHGELADIHLWIGMSLVLGFVFMLLIDQIGSGGHSHNSSGQGTATR